MNKYRELLFDKVTKDAVLDNTTSTYVSSSTGINFKLLSSDTNGKGTYIRLGTEHDTFPIYYYRGNIDNNNVIFANHCWKIVRTTDTGGIKMIYNGEKSSDGKCISTAPYIGNSKFNEIATSKNYSSIGYMYGPIFERGSLYTQGIKQLIVGKSWQYYSGQYYLNETEIVADGFIGAGNYYRGYYTCSTESSICSKLYYVDSLNSYYGFNYIELVDGFALEDGDNYNSTEITSSNKMDSTVKKLIDDWYRNNLFNYTEYLEDTLWCNDRKISSSSGSVTFAGYNRIMSGTPSLTCSKQDAFSVNNALGNQKLKYPVALLTADEHMLAGQITGGFGNNYLEINTGALTLTPGNASETTFGVIGTDSGGLIPKQSAMIRPAVSLKHEITIAGGTGSSTNPYLIQ